MSVQAGVYRIKNVETGKYMVLTSGANNTTVTAAAAAAGDKKALVRPFIT
jgi:phosphoribosylformylglycinamidine (FGAM) synthase PurS component